MTAPFSVDMNAVTRLTKAGRLLEATALLRRVLSGTAGQKVPSDIDHSTSPAAGRSTPMIDMSPPSVTGGAWTSSTSASPTKVPRPQSGPDLSIPSNARLFAHLTGKLEAYGAPPALRGGVPVARTPLPTGARFDVRSVSNASGRMHYKLYVPSRYNGKPLSLVIMLHGCTQSPDDFAAGTQMNEVAEEVPCLVAYPEQTTTANASKCWNWFKPDDQRRDHGEPSLIAEATRQIMQDYAIDSERVFVAGLSAGGAAAAIMGHEYPDIYKGVCVHSGLACGSARDIPSAFAAMRNGNAETKGIRPHSKLSVPTIVFHGSADKTVNPANADHVAHQSKSGIRTSAVTKHGRSPGGMDFTRTLECNEAGDVILEQWVLHGAGHAWSGGSNKGSYTEPRGPDASREMMRFFSEVTRADASA